MKMFIALSAHKLYLKLHEGQSSLYAELGFNKPITRCENEAAQLVRRAS